VNRRIALLIAAVIVAGLGTTMVFLYVKSADDRAIEAQAPVTVLVAKLPIAAGTKVQDAANAGSFEAQEFPAGSVTPGALSSVEALAEALAVAPIFPGQQILSAMFGTTAATTSGTGLALPAGKIAISVQFGDPQRVAGFVVPGSDVVVFASGAIGDTPDATRVLIPRATVVAAGPTTVTPPTDPALANVEVIPKALLTLALDQADAEKIIFASTRGTLYLGLLNTASQIAPGPGVTADSLFT
jgi:pilus assembly protein CpaB